MGRNLEPKAPQPIRLRLTRELQDQIDKARATGMHAASTRTDFLLVLLTLGLEEINRIESERRQGKKGETKRPDAAKGA